jgi:HTH-type transcriptional regulator/antitoxin HigA
MQQRFKFIKMEITLIKSEKDYQRALRRLEEIFDAEDGTKEGDEAEILTLLIEKYEDEKYPIEAPDPIEAIKFRMEQLGLKQKDLAQILGYKSRVSELLSRKRKLNLSMIRSLHEKLRIPYESLMSSY